MNDARYTLPSGKSVFTSDFLRTRGTCCKSGCLHCPYNFTLINFGIKFVPIENRDYANEILAMHGHGNDIASQLLQEGLGGKKFDLSKYSDNQIWVMTLKYEPCGFMIEKDGDVIKYFLHPNFMSQGITEKIIIDHFQNRH